MVVCWNLGNLPSLQSPIATNCVVSLYVSALPAVRRVIQRTANSEPHKLLLLAATRCGVTAPIRRAPRSALPSTRSPEPGAGTGQAGEVGAQTAAQIGRIQPRHPCMLARSRSTPGMRTQPQAPLYRDCEHLTCAEDPNFTQAQLDSDLLAPPDRCGPGGHGTADLAQGSEPVAW
jgi:hypothetical protein